MKLLVLIGNQKCFVKVTDHSQQTKLIDRDTGKHRLRLLLKCK